MYCSFQCIPNSSHRHLAGGTILAGTVVVVCTEQVFQVFQVGLKSHFVSTEQTFGCFASAGSYGG